jgi:hypothetical protein
MLAHKDRNAQRYSDTQHDQNERDDVLALRSIHEGDLMPQNPKQAVLK